MRMSMIYEELVAALESIGMCIEGLKKLGYDDLATKLAEAHHTILVVKGEFERREEKEWNELAEEMAKALKFELAKKPEG